MRVALCAALALVLAAAAPAATGPAAAPVSGADVVTGKPVSLDRYRGKRVVLNFWASWCGGCILEADDLRAFVKAHPDVAVVGIDVNDSRTAARAFARKYAFRHPSVFDPRGRIADSYRLKGLPTTVILDRAHHEVLRIAGATTLDQLDDELAKVD